MESFLLFTLFFILFSACFIFPPPEFVSLGLTVESLFSFYLKSETNSFIYYHIKRAVATLMTHCSLPLVYILIVSYMFPEWSTRSENLFWSLFVTVSLIPPTVCGFMIFSWQKENWSNHPIARKLKKFVTQTDDIEQIRRDITNEYRSINKIIIKCNVVTKVIATDNWIIKITPYDLCLAHQSDVSLVVSSSNQYKYLPGRTEGGHFLSIDIRSSRANICPFKIRINSLDFKDLQEKVSRPINLMENIIVHQSLTDRFLSAFKSHVQQNPKVVTNENLDICIGCMLNTPNVKLLTSCGDVTGSQKCTMCYCKPLWCIDCMGKWFASRQDQNRLETWLSSKCTCPMCRNTFCILDVCPLVRVDKENDNDRNS